MSFFDGVVPVDSALDSGDEEMGDAEKGSPILGLQILRSFQGNVKFDDLDGIIPPGVQLFRLFRGLIVEHLTKLVDKPGASMSRR